MRRVRVGGVETEQSEQGRGVGRVFSRRGQTVKRGKVGCIRSTLRVLS